MHSSLAVICQRTYFFASLHDATHAAGFVIAIFRHILIGILHLRQVARSVVGILKSSTIFFINLNHTITSVVLKIQLVAIGRVSSQEISCGIAVEGKLQTAVVLDPDERPLLRAASSIRIWK